MPIVELSPEELRSCRTADEWLNAFITKNPSLSVLEVSRCYGERIGARWGPLDFEAVLRAQERVGAISREELERFHAQVAAKRVEASSRLASARSRSVSELRALDDEALLRDVRLRLLVSTEKTHRDAAPEVVRLVQDLIHLDDEVRNGGFHQYFLNGGRARVESAIEGLRRVGEVRAAELVGRARDMAVGFPEVDFSALDREYRALAPSPEWRGWGLTLRSVPAFVREHLDEFASIA
jgi:hypothetical protein